MKGPVLMGKSAAAAYEMFADVAFQGTDRFSIPSARLSPEVSSAQMQKSYVERRSWLAPLRSFWRIHSFLLQALPAHLAVLACSLGGLPGPA